MLRISSGHCYRQSLNSAAVAEQFSCPCVLEFFNQEIAGGVIDHAIVAILHTRRTVRRCVEAEKLVSARCGAEDFPVGVLDFALFQHVVKLLGLHVLLGGGVLDCVGRVVFVGCVVGFGWVGLGDAVLDGGVGVLADDGGGTELVVGVLWPSAGVSEPLKGLMITTTATRIAMTTAARPISFRHLSPWDGAGGVGRAGVAGTGAGSDDARAGVGLGGVAGCGDAGDVRAGGAGSGSCGVDADPGDAESLVDRFAALASASIVCHLSSGCSPKAMRI